jgi:hypothetical protein
MLADEAEPYIKAFRQADFMLRIQTGNAACEESFLGRQHTRNA